MGQTCWNTCNATPETKRCMHRIPVAPGFYQSRFAAEMPISHAVLYSFLPQYDRRVTILDEGLTMSNPSFVP